MGGPLGCTRFLFCLTAKRFDFPAIIISDNKHEVINTHYTPSGQLLIKRFFIPKDCANIYGHSYMHLVAHTFWASFRSHFDCNQHFIECLLIFNVTLSHTILFVQVFGLALRNIHTHMVGAANQAQTSSTKFSVLFVYFGLVPDSQ